MFSVRDVKIGQDGIRFVFPVYASGSGATDTPLFKIHITRDNEYDAEAKLVDVGLPVCRDSSKTETLAAASLEFAAECLTHCEDIALEFISCARQNGLPS